ncbi:MAG: helix-turn-helix domain-containing protein [Prevotella sp.]|nr:helix-turn-helix domain-containing protein [Prevotella sp.]
MEKTPKTQATTTMKNITFDGMPVALAFLHEKCDTIIALLSNIDNGSSSAAMHTPIGMTEASKLLGKSPSTIYEMTSKRKIPFHKRGNKLYFFQDELLKWITDGGCSDTDYPDTDTANIDDRKADEHLKSLRAEVRRKPKPLMP